ncbi:reverse transcriptase family protein [Halopseudomonas sp.]|uniref:reverse transcriptase family protein n=1 Tax=Halopseudomonas sp. TaxID=2901191 RepID=UPI0030021009|tara:strand:- start:381 stop:1574 length:1194 start_codon:yes stop_codon:yes gene_type:complete
MARSKQSFSFKKSSGSISNITNLASALGLSVDDFEDLWRIPDDQRYKPKPIPKASGGERIVYNPCKELRAIQRKINERIFSNPNIIQWPSFLYGSIPSSKNPDDKYRSRDYISCAQQHCQSRSILKLDIKDFFDNIHDDIVLGVFADLLAYPEEVSMVLTKACTHQGRLVQGALTSSYLAMLCLHGHEESVVLRLKRKGLTYTRFVDDITISTMKSNHDFSYAIKIVEDMLVSLDLPLNKKKTSIQHSSATPLTVHGLRVSFPQPRLPSDEVRRIRSAVQELEIVSAEGNYRYTYPYRQNFNRCMGRVNKLSRVKHPQHQRLVRRLRKILPLASKREINYVISAVDKLEKYSLDERSSYWYKKHYYRVADRLNLVKRTHPSMVAELRLRMNGIVPRE